MAYRITAELLGGPEDGRTITLPALERTLLFHVHDSPIAVLAAPATMPARIECASTAIYRLEEHRACRSWQCASLNHHRYTFAGQR